MVAGADDAEIADAAGSELGQRVVRPLWVDLGADVMGRLNGVTLEDLCRRAHDAGIASQSANTPPRNMPVAPAATLITPMA